MSPTIQLNSTTFDVELAPAHQSLLDFIRQTAGLTGTKEGCASGDCGACTVVLRDSNGQHAQNINSCITPVGAAIGKQVITVEGAGTPDHPHPVQQALVDEHGSQCGFCTPGFVMSLVAAQLQGQTSAKTTPANRAAAIESVSGNLCRCTGYRPIIDAALIARDGTANLPAVTRHQLTQVPTSLSYHRPAKLAELLAVLAKNGHRRSLISTEGRTERRTENNADGCSEPSEKGDAAKDETWLIAGATDAFLEVSQRYLDPTHITDLGNVEELRHLSTAQNGDLIIGAAVTHAETLAYFSQPHCQNTAITGVLKRFGSPQIRGRGTVGGNIANASPIADWPPLLIALDASLNLIDTQGAERTIRLDEFYLGYKSTQLRANELIKSVKIPASIQPNALYAHKISKRFEDDISSALAALYLEFADETKGAQENKIAVARIGFGGVGPIPMRCSATENLLIGQVLSASVIDTAVHELGNEITPMSDIRASEAYRRQVSKAVLQNLLFEALRRNEASQ